MDISKVISVRKEMQQSGTIMAYNGEITDELMVSLGVILKERLKSLDNAKVSRTVFTVFMETMQNVIWHSDKQGSNNHGMITISNDNDQINVVCSNRVNKNKIEKLRNSLELIKNADKDEIKKLYREGMTKSNDHEGPGAGLGLLEIARRSSTPISYEFVEVNDNEVDFYISAIV